MEITIDVHYNETCVQDKMENEMLKRDDEPCDVRERTLV